MVASPELLRNFCPWHPIKSVKGSFWRMNILPHRPRGAALTALDING